MSRLVSVAFAALTVASAYGFNFPASKLHSSRVRSAVEMAKKSVGDLSEDDLKGKRVLVR